MTFTLDKYMPYSVGFETLFDRLGSLSTIDVKGYPYYNIKKADDTQWVIELALAGFDKKDIKIDVKDGVMTIQGEMKEEEGEYLHKGISTRKFSKSFSLAEYTEPKSAEMKNGILYVTLEQEVPEEKKPKTIEIM
jgi:molecular chaperone IbpA